MMIAALVGGTAGSASASGEGGVETRRVEFNYSATISELPADAKVVDLWMPVPSDTQGQLVETVKMNHDGVPFCRGCRLAYHAR